MLIKKRMCDVFRLISALSSPFPFARTRTHSLLCSLCTPNMLCTSFHPPFLSNSYFSLCGQSPPTGKCCLSCSTPTALPEFPSGSSVELELSGRSLQDNIQEFYWIPWRKCWIISLTRIRIRLPSHGSHRRSSGEVYNRCSGDDLRVRLSKTRDPPNTCNQPKQICWSRHRSEPGVANWKPK